VTKHFGGIDILVNNDGAPPLGEIETFDDTAWQKAVEQNLMYVVRMARGVLPHMKARGGSILNITAISAIQPIAGFGLSVATWSGVIGFAKTLSLEVARHGITVNTICPGYVETSRLEKVFAAGGQDPDIMRNQLKAEVPLGRIGTVDDIASLVALLVSPRGGYITGATIAVDGGLLRAVR
jgi:3-oxoacyl-[acyl-carrier protein] reductase